MIRNWKKKKKKPKARFPLMLTAEILYESQNTILELVWKYHFSVEHCNLKSQTPSSKRSKILPSPPILVDNLIKVGGRIRHSNIPDQQKHQTVYFTSSLSCLPTRSNRLSRKISSLWS